MVAVPRSNYDGVVEAVGNHFKFIPQSNAEQGFVLGLVLGTVVRIIDQDVSRLTVQYFA
jgi:hypothetical protein